MTTTVRKRYLLLLKHYILLDYTCNVFFSKHSGLPKQEII